MWADQIENGYFYNHHEDDVYEILDVALKEVDEYYVDWVSDPNSDWEYARVPVLYYYDDEGDKVVLDDDHIEEMATNNTRFHGWYFKEVLVDVYA